ncbi:MAG: hypothetical protein WD645_06120 [Dehalococcoidia bacterium]
MVPDFHRLKQLALPLSALENPATREKVRLADCIMVWDRPADELRLLHRVSFLEGGQEAARIDPTNLVARFPRR